MSHPEFWNDSYSAQWKLREIKWIRSRIESIGALESAIEYLKELSEIGLDDTQVFWEASEALDRAEEMATMDGPMDSRDAIICLQAKNWPEGCVEVERLRRMFRQQAIKWGYNVQVLTVSEHEQGLGFAAFSVLGPYGFGWAKKLKLQHQDVIDEVLPEVHLAEIRINKEDVSIALFRRSNLNGQGIAVSGVSIDIIHQPTGIVVPCNTEKSSWHARHLGMQILLAKVWAQNDGIQRALLDFQKATKISSCISKNIQ